MHPPQQGLLEGFSSGLVALANFASTKLPSVNIRLMDLGLADEDGLKCQIQQAVSESAGILFVGITTTTASYQSALKVADLFKRTSPKCLVVFGGHHASAQSNVILNHHAYIDCVVRGEGEIALVELITRYPRLDEVPSLTYRSGLEVKENPHEAPRLSTEALDGIPPTYQGWGLRSAPGKFDHTTYVSARGCPLRCAFCAVSNAAIHNKSIPSVIRDLRVLVGDMGYKRIAIEDNFFAHSPKRTIDLCQAIEELQRELPFQWDCQTRVESYKNENVVDAMERAGCEAVYLGVESLDPEHLLYLRGCPKSGLFKFCDGHY
ncbi:MAG: cobalamin-dependent protein, partial [Planctomycetaceae bacterium]|nr:cobalamin-dependent protein [Planctomycetaceae bacterium]